MDQAAREREVAELRRQVRELTDRNEIAELIACLARYLDEKRFDEARSVFTEDAIGPFGDRASMCSPSAHDEITLRSRGSGTS